MDKKIRLLLAEDEPSLGLIIKESLETRNFEVQLVNDGEKAFSIFKAMTFDVIILDVMMPIKDGFTLAKQIRAVNKLIPIIFLTAKSQTSDVVEGFSIGGNDYLKKPFSMEELIVRIHAQLNKLIQNTPNIQIGSYTFDPTKQILLFDLKVFSLTHRESALLELLLHNKNQVIERSTILEELWGNDDFFNGRSMDVFISKLRKKLALDASIKIINSRGLGYKIIY